jgi:hypothetical protein
VEIPVPPFAATNGDPSARLPPVILPVADINPPVNMLTPVTLPLADTVTALVVTNAPIVVRLAPYVTPLYTSGTGDVPATVVADGRADILTVAIILFLLYYYIFIEQICL